MARAGCSIMVVCTLRVRVVRVRFPAARPYDTFRVFGRVCLLARLARGEAGRKGGLRERNSRPARALVFSRAKRGNQSEFFSKKFERRSVIATCHRHAASAAPFFVSACRRVFPNAAEKFPASLAICAGTALYVYLLAVASGTALLAQLARALPSHGRGRRFESCRVHTTQDISSPITKKARDVSSCFFGAHINRPARMRCGSGANRVT